MILENELLECLSRTSGAGTSWNARLDNVGRKLSAVKDDVLVCTTKSHEGERKKDQALRCEGYRSNSYVSWRNRSLRSVAVHVMYAFSSILIGRGALLRRDRECRRLAL